MNTRHDKRLAWGPRRNERIPLWVQSGSRPPSWHLEPRPAALVAGAPSSGSSHLPSWDSAGFLGLPGSY